MKDKITIIIFIVILFIIVLFNFKSYTNVKLDETIIDKNWYKYNILTGYYDILNISENNIKFIKPDDTNDLNKYDNCDSYSYDKKNKTLNLNCKSKIKINNITNNSLDINFDNVNQKFFTNMQDSLNYEFEKYYKKSLSEYKKEKFQVSEVIKINDNKLLELVKEDKYSKIIFYGDKCSSIECTLVLNIMEKLYVADSSSIFYYNANEINNNLLKKLNKIDKKFENDVNFYNNVYPRIIIVKNNKIVDTYEIKCSGLNCTKYMINEF